MHLNWINDPSSLVGQEFFLSLFLIPWDSWRSLEGFRLDYDGQDSHTTENAKRWFFFAHLATTRTYAVHPTCSCISALSFHQSQKKDSLSFFPFSLKYAIYSDSNIAEILCISSFWVSVYCRVMIFEVQYIEVVVQTTTFSMKYFKVLWNFEVKCSCKIFSWPPKTRCTKFQLILSSLLEEAGTVGVGEKTAKNTTEFTMHIISANIILAWGSRHCGWESKREARERSGTCCCLTVKPSAPHFYFHFPRYHRRPACF